MIYYKNENSKLYNGDCIQEIVNNNLHFDKVITSPPYNIIRPNCTDRGYDEYKDRLITNEQYADWICDLFHIFDRYMNENGVVMFNMSYGTENTECMIDTIYNVIHRTNFTLADIIVWKKKSATPNNVSSNKMTRICEFVFVLCRRSEFMTFTSNKKVVGKRDTGQSTFENVFNFFEANNNDGSTDINKATFSSEFVENLIDRYVLKDDIVLDCFSGTGTTMKVCEQKGIKFIGVETSEKQCQYTVDRIKNVQMQLF